MSAYPSVYPFDPPVDAGIGCRHCGDPIVATGQIFDGHMQIQGLSRYEWVHGHGSHVCRPKTHAQPFDGWDATRLIKAALAARREAEDAADDPPGQR